MHSRNKTCLALILPLGFCLLFTSFNAVSGKLYKWIDEEGNVHYTDVIPPESIKNKHSTLTNDGIALETTEREKTKQERLLLKQQAEAKKAQLEEKKRLAAESERKRKIQRNYDRRLLNTYLTEEDLIKRRDNQLATIEGTITLTQSNLKKLDALLIKQIKENADSKADGELSEKSAQETLETRKQIKEFNQFISNRQAEKRNIRTQFNNDLKRLRELLSAR